MAETNTAESREALLLAKWEATARRYDELTHQLTEASALSQPRGSRAQIYPALLANLDEQRRRLAQPAGAVPASVLHHFDHLLLALRLHRAFFIQPIRS